jgi:hypothetical protein
MTLHCFLLLFLFLVNVVSYNWNSATRYVNSFKDSKFSRQTISSSRKEKQESQAVKRRKQLKVRKAVLAAGVNRHLSFRTTNSSNYESIISLYLRRSSSARKARKTKGINYNWFYYKDIVVRGRPVLEAISVIDNGMGGTIQETAQNYLQNSVSFYLSSCAQSSMVAYKELLSFDPRIKASLSCENLEFGFEIKKKDAKLHGSRLKEKTKNERTIFPVFLSSMLSSGEKKKKDLDFFIDRDKMDNFMLRSGSKDSNIGRKERLASLLSVIDSYINSIILDHSATDLLISCDGSAKYRYPSNQTDLCISGGISVIPFIPDTKEKHIDQQLIFRSLQPGLANPEVVSYHSITNHSLLFNVHPVSNLASSPLDSELMAFISSLIVANLFQQRLKLISAEKNITSNCCNLHFISDSRSLCRLFRLSNTINPSSVPEPSTYSSSSSTIFLVDLLKQQKLLLCRTMKSNLLTVSKGKLDLKWVRSHPENAVLSSPSR